MSYSKLLDRQISAYLQARPKRWEVPVLAFGAALAVSGEVLNVWSVIGGLALAGLVLISAVLRARRTGMLVLPWTPPPEGAKIKRNMSKAKVGLGLMMASTAALILSFAIDNAYLFLASALFLALAATAVSLSSELSKASSD